MTTRLSSKGQIVVPRPIREAHRWKAGTTFEVVETADGILLRVARLFPQSRLEDVVGCAGYRGPARSVAEMDEAVREEAGRHRR
jgi:AbrB family looped-hinge helix DNA binding protein